MSAAKFPSNNPRVAWSPEIDVRMTVGTHPRPSTRTAVIHDARHSTMLMFKWWLGWRARNAESICSLQTWV